jgi:putative transposase
MRTSKFTESQILAIIGEGEAGLAVVEVCRKHGISTATYYQWRSKYAGMSANELRRVKELEAENSRLKRMYADLALENAAIKDVLSRKLRRRQLSVVQRSAWCLSTVFHAAKLVRSWDSRGRRCTNPRWTGRPRMRQ